MIAGERRGHAPSQRSRSCTRSSLSPRRCRSSRCSGPSASSILPNGAPNADVVSPPPGVADRGDDPAVVAIDADVPLCAGALVAPDVVLTSRHCVSVPAPPIALRARRRRGRRGASRAAGRRLAPRPRRRGHGRRSRARARSRHRRARGVVDVRGRHRLAPARCAHRRRAASRRPRHGRGAGRPSPNRRLAPSGARGLRAEGPARAPARHRRVRHGARARRGPRRGRRPRARRSDGRGARDLFAERRRPVARGYTRTDAFMASSSAPRAEPERVRERGERALRKAKKGPVDIGAYCARAPIAPRVSACRTSGGLSSIARKRAAAHDRCPIAGFGASGAQAERGAAGGAGRVPRSGMQVCTET